MVGSTVAMAAAASFPAPFVSSGSANVAVVVGAQAALSDAVAATSIGSKLATSLAAQTATEGTTTESTVEGGDAVTIKSGTNLLNLGEALTIVGTINDEDMGTFLASGTYKDLAKTEFTYDQEISVAGTTVAYSESSAYKDKTPTLGLFYDKDAAVLNYSVDFNGLNFTDSIGTDLPLMGNTYYVLDYSVADGLTLLDSSASATISEGETTTITVEGKSYEVTLDFVGDATTDYAKFTVNGESLDKINEGSDDELADGSYLAVKEVLYSSKESGVSKVEFTIGKGKLLLPTDGEIEMNDDRVVNVDSTVDNANGIITLKWNTDAKVVLTEAGDELILPGFNTIKVAYNGITFPEAEMTSLDASGVLELETVVKDGAVTLPLVDQEAILAAGNLSYLGEATDTRLILGSVSSTNSSVGLGQVGDYFVATYAYGDNSESYVYMLDSIKYDADGKTEVVLDNMASTDSTDDITFADIGRTRTKGELTFALGAANETTEDVTIYVQAARGVSTRKLVTAEGLSINLTGFANLATLNMTTGVNLTFVEADEDNNLESGLSFVATLVESADDNIHVTSTNVTTLETKTADVDEGYVISKLATKVMLDKTDADAQDFSISYYGQEIVADVFVAASTATITGSTTSGSATELGSVTVYDNEAASVSGKNLIVVGGSCINSIAAELLGGAACDAAFTAKTGINAGEAIIKSFDKSGKVALLVAGYNAADTAKAATYLVNNAVNTSVGAALKVTSATEATAITA